MLFISVGGLFVVVDIVREGFSVSLLLIWRGSIIGNKLFWGCLLLSFLSFCGLFWKGSVVNEGEFEEVVNKVNWFL